MKHYYLLGFSVVLILLISGCASIISGSTQRLNITTEPEEARIEIYDENNMEIWSASSPSTVTLDRGAGFFKGASYRVEITKKGYRKKTVYINASLNGGWYIAGNFLLGGLLGWLIIDPATGAMWTLSPENVYAGLEQSDAEGSSYHNGSLHIVLRENITEAEIVSLGLQPLPSFR
jgi:hypothetical protein